MRKYYKESLIVKNNLLQSFDNSYKFSVLKKDLLCSKNLKYVNFLNLMLIKQNYYINILLWRLHFFSSTNEASYFINNNFVFVNGKVVKSNYFLNSGDIITFKDSFFFNFKKNLRTYKMFKSLRSFVEIDYYTCSLIVIKDFDNFTLDDFSSFLSSSINISSVYNNIR
jgi:ribosomal protein S4